MCAALLLAAFGGCYKNHSDENGTIAPLKASISIPNPTGSAPVVYLRVSSGDDPNDDMVPLDLVLRSSAAPISFDAFDVEVREENPSQPGVPAPGIVQFIFEQGATQKTPFGICNISTTCTAQGKCNGAGAACTMDAQCGLGGICTMTGYTCDNPNSCQPCASCPANENPGFSAVITDPFCSANLAAGGADILLGVSSVPNASCPQTRTLAANSEMVIAQFILLASASGSVRIRFQQNPAKTGDCEILAYGAPGTPPVDLGIPFDDGGAVFTAQ